MKKKRQLCENFIKKGKELYSNPCPKAAPKGFNAKVMRHIHTLNFKQIKENNIIEHEEILLWRFSIAGILIGLLSMGLFYLNYEDKSYEESLGSGYSIQAYYGEDI